MRLSGVDLNLLVALDALLTERNVTRAGERLSVGQPAMSASLARLRKHFDDPLLVREGRSSTLTPLAESLVEPVRSAIGAVEAVLGRPADFEPAREARTFTIVASDYVLLVLLRRLIAVLAVEAPRIQVCVKPITAGYVDQLRRRQADFLIMPTEITGKRFGFPSEPLFTDRYVLAVDRHNQAVGDTITVEEFVALPYAAYAGGTGVPVIEAQLEELGITRRNVISTQSFVTAPLLLRDTPVVGLVHERLARLVAEPARLRILEPPVPLPPFHEALYWNPQHARDPAHEWLRKRLVELARELDFPGDGPA
ncbi:LysR substrate-binding domain-containing protein [Saccharopolyspora sp. NPDC050642]|uniref:LysR family transcriptional regulator n=1 Tax=Saccharopolyspora sp. NPDC050642 TaxID=3157099 RepID=UPI0033D4E08B